MRKFGAPETIIHQSQYWTVMLRPAQVTLGSLVLAANETAHAFSQLSQASFTELHTITAQLEAALAKAFVFYLGSPARERHAIHRTFNNGSG